MLGCGHSEEVRWLTTKSKFGLLDKIRPEEENVNCLEGNKWKEWMPFLGLGWIFFGTRKMKASTPK
jgi:hypothetical protein